MYPIPANAKRVRYITFDGTQSVEACIPTNSHKFRIVYQGHAGNGEEANVIGLYDNTSGTANRVYIGPYPQRSNARCMLVATEYNISQSITDTLVEQTVDIPNHIHSVVKNGTTYTATIGNFGTLVTQKPVGIGAREWQSTASPYRKIEMPFVGNIYAFQSWVSGVLQHDWVPVVKGGVAGFFDRVDGSFHTERVGNALVAGPDTFAQGVLPTRMCVMGIRKKKVWSTPLYTGVNLVPQLGTNRGQSYPLNGTIDLNYTYLVRDGALFWEGAAGAYKNVKTTYPD